MRIQELEAIQILCVNMNSAFSYKRFLALISVGLFVCLSVDLLAEDKFAKWKSEIRNELKSSNDLEQKFDLCVKLLGHHSPKRPLDSINSIYLEIQIHLKPFSRDSQRIIRKVYAGAIADRQLNKSRRILRDLMKNKTLSGAHAWLGYSGQMFAQNKLDSAIYYALPAMDFYKSDLEKYGRDYGHSSFYLFMAYKGLNKYSKSLETMHEVRKYAKPTFKAHVTATMLRYAIRSNKLEDELKIVQLVKDEHNNFTDVNIPSRFAFIVDKKTISRRIAQFDSMLLGDRLHEKDKYYTLKHISFLQYQNGKYNEAVAYQKRSNKYLTELNLRRTDSAYSMLYHIYKFKLNNVDSALHYFEKLSAVRKENQDLALKESIAEWETKYKTAEQDRGIIQSTEKLNSTKTQQQGLLLGGLGLLGIGGLFYYLLRRRIKRQLELSKQEEDIRKNEMERIKDERKVQILNASISGAEKERKKIAEQLNNGVGQRLRVLQDNVNVISRNYQPLGRELEAASALIESSGSELNSIAQNIMPAQLIEGSLVNAVQDFIRPYNFSGEMDIQLKSVGEFNGLPENLTLGVYRIIQELVKNAIKYSDAKQIEIVLIQSKTEYTFSVHDNGKGFDVSNVKKGLGLSGAQSRIEHWGGGFELTSRDGVGTHIKLTVPQKKIVEDFEGNRSAIN